MPGLFERLFEPCCGAALVAVLSFGSDERRFTAEEIAALKESPAGKLVPVTDYVIQRPKIDAFYDGARARGYVPYATRRELDVLRMNSGHEPD